MQTVMASSWLDQYTEALRNRDAREKANLALVNTYTKLADSQAQNAPSIPLVNSGKDSPSIRPPAPIVPVASPDPSAGLEALRTDLSSANASLHALHGTNKLLTNRIQTLTHESASLSSQLASLKSDMSTAGTSHSNAVTKLQAEKRQLERRLRDKEEEVSQKAKLVQDVQDENLALETEIKVMEGRVQDLEAENGRLVQRWVERVGWEAEQGERPANSRGPNQRKAG